MVMQQSNAKEIFGIEPGEYNYWKDTGMLEFDSFEKYLKSIH